MRSMKLGSSQLEAPVVAVGCMRMKDKSKAEAEKFVKGAMDAGANFFDHANVYGDGLCEEMFAEAIGMTPTVREKVILQSKCGIRRKVAFDFSRDNILKAVDGSLKRLKTDYLDVLLLHRPDALVEPEEVAEALGRLHADGKVRHFGVSNQPPMLIQLLQKYVSQPFVANQLQFSITNATMISSDLTMNTARPEAVSRDGGILNYCRLNNITIQPWSPFQYGYFEGIFLDNPKFPELNEKIGQIAAKYGVSKVTVTMAWLLRHPARMQPVTGTMNLDRLRDCLKAADITLTRDEWYAIYLAAGNILP
ncbi:MAG: aldo/keto reductase [Planctomycetota bacterium]|nr:aldo/keto reductase [Planctomycetota bacterium]